MYNKTKSIVTNIQEVICLFEDDFKDCKILLHHIVAEVLKEPNFTGPLVSFINNQLSNAQTRKKGLQLLNAFLIVSESLEFIDENAISWLNNSLKYYQHEVVICDEAYIVIDPLLKFCYGTPELNKSVCSGILAKLIEQITKIHKTGRSPVAAFQCLETCLKLYSGPVATYKNALEKYLIEFVDSDSFEGTRMAGKCLHHLQQVGGGGTQGVNHKQGWKNQQLSLCKTIHKIMDSLFESVTEMSEYQQDDADPLGLPALLEGNRIHLNARRVINCAIFLQEMLLGAFPTAKAVSPVAILSVISRGLNVTTAILGKQIVTDALTLSGNLSHVHKHLLELLQALIVCLKGNLIPYAYMITKLVTYYLSKAPPVNANNVDALCEVRITAMQTLALWMTVARSGSCGYALGNTLVKIVMNDITPAVNEVNLTVQKVPDKYMSKKARKQLQQEQITESSIAKTYRPGARKVSTSANTFQVKICRAGLRLLQTLLENNGYFIGLGSHKTLQNFAIKTLADIQRGIILSPYEDVDCRVQLYKLLTKLTTNHHRSMAPPIDYTIYILSKSQSDPEPLIAEACSAGLSNLNSFIHPVAATLDFPVDLDALRTEMEAESKENHTDSQINHCMEIADDDADSEDSEATTIKLKTDQMDVEASLDLDSQSEQISKVVVDSGSEPENESNGEKEPEDLNSPEKSEKPKSANLDVFEEEEQTINEVIQVISDDENTQKSLESKKPDSKGHEQPTEVSLEISDEDAEQLTIEEAVESLNEDTETNEENKENKTEEGKEENNLSSSDDEESGRKSRKRKAQADDPVMDLAEEEMISAFVDIVNE